MKKVFIIEGSDDYRRMFIDAGWEITPDFFKADLIQFTGGSDVTPALYGEQEHFKTSSYYRRDLVEAGYYKHGILAGKNMAGICRGGQFLNVMNGGKMYQHVDGHAIGHTHKLVDAISGKEYQVTSTHHQMMRRGPNSKLVAYADESTECEFMAEDVLAIHYAVGMDIEALFYEKTKSLCFQPHPEFYGMDSTREYYFELLERYFKL